MVQGYLLKKLLLSFKLYRIYIYLRFKNFNIYTLNALVDIL